MSQKGKLAAVRIWLLSSVFLVICMVAVGGLTRLTRSGLSIVEWKPVAGVLPPLNDEDWQQEFDKYKAFPQYQKENRGMSLDEFKYIFFWEYGHRLLGRIIGLAFALPLLVFLWQRRITGKLAGKLLIALLLGGVQAFLGWFMVKSGLVDQPNVSHFRLATHLLMALFLMSFLYWIAMDLKMPLSRVKSTARLRPLSLVFLGLVVLQIFFGALTAGLRAGLVYNTFPTMNGYWIPAGIGSMGTVWDLFINPVTVQFVHRSIAWLIAGTALWLLLLSRREQGLSRRQIGAFQIIAAVVSLQFTLGVLTLIYRVPVALGSLHQIGACFLLLASVNAVHAIREGRAYSSPLIEV